MKTIISIILVLSVLTGALAADVIVKQLKEFRIELSSATVPDVATTEKKIRNYFTRKGLAVEDIHLLQAGSGASPWVVEVICSFNFEDFRKLSLGEFQARFKDVNSELSSITLED